MKLIRFCERRVLHLFEKDPRYQAVESEFDREVVNSICYNKGEPRPLNLSFLFFSFLLCQSKSGLLWRLCVAIGKTKNRGHQSATKSEHVEVTRSLRQLSILHCQVKQKKNTRHFNPTIWERYWRKVPGRIGEMSRRCSKMIHYGNQWIESTDLRYLKTIWKSSRKR